MAWMVKQTIWIASRARLRWFKSSQISFIGPQITNKNPNLHQGVYNLYSIHPLSLNLWFNQERKGEKTLKKQFLPCFSIKRYYSFSPLIWCTFARTAVTVNPNAFSDVLMISASLQTFPLYFSLNCQSRRKACRTFTQVQAGESSARRVVILVSGEGRKASVVLIN